MEIIEPVLRSDGLYEIKIGLRSLVLENVDCFIYNQHWVLTEEFYYLESQLFLLNDLLYKPVKVVRGLNFSAYLTMWKFEPL